MIQQLKSSAACTPDTLMVMKMTKDELIVFYARLAELTEKGSEADVRAYVNQEYPRLPEETQQEIVFNLFASALEQREQNDDVIVQIQEQGLEAAEKLEKLKEELEAGGLTE